MSKYRLVFVLLLLFFVAAKGSPRTDFLPSDWTPSAESAPEIFSALSGASRSTSNAKAFSCNDKSAMLWLAELADRPGAFIEPIRNHIKQIEFVKAPKDRVYATYRSGEDEFALALVYDAPASTLLLVVKGLSAFSTLKWTLENHKPLKSGPPAYVYFLILLTSVILFAWMYWKRGFRGTEND